MDDAEITTEIHPTHATLEKLKAFRDVGVTRVSLGIQSFSDQLLRGLGASHDERNSHEAVQAALATFERVAIDLLYCFKGQSLEDWLRDLSQAVEEYAIGHLSCYALVPVNSDLLRPSQIEEIRFAEAAISVGKRRGLFHYASCASGGFDLAIPEEQCRYEKEHWGAPQAEFCGLGPGAFGFCADHTTANRLAVNDYCSCLESGRLPLAALGGVPEEELRRRYFALGVKTLEVPFGPYSTQFNRNPRDDFGPIFEDLEALDLVQVERDSLVLTEVGRHFVDSCSAAFFSSTESDVPHPEEPEIRALERELDPV
jgi:oxygen-independent coproporphyrinogen-3 oxidase